MLMTRRSSGASLAGQAAKTVGGIRFELQVGVKPTFHGIASLPASSEPGWASEAHRDAHFIAGTWAFPEFDWAGARVSALADFYGKLFADFFTVVQSTLMLGDTPIKFEATATSSVRGSCTSLGSLTGATNMASARFLCS